MADGQHSLFALGQRGVNTAVSAVHIEETELVAAQNAEIPISDGGLGVIDQRAGMSLMTPTVVDTTITAIHDVPAPLQNDLIPHLVVSMYGGYPFRSTQDGSVWQGVPLYLNNVYAMNGFTDLAYFHSWPKLVTIGNKIYYIGQPNTTGVDPLPLNVFDGRTTTLASYVPPAVTGVVLGTPAAPVVGFNGAVASTTYSYVVVPRNGSAHGAASAAGTITYGAASLSTSNYAVVLPNTPPMAGASSYDVYRTAGGGTTGKVGSIPVVGGQFTTNNGSGLPGGYPFTDGGLTGDGTTAPNTNTGSLAVNPLAIADMITDGVSLYLAAVDTTSSIAGRILQFDPIALAWSQIGASFPIAAGNGTPGSLVNYNGAISYGTYTGTAAGNTTYLTTTNTPLPDGGITDVKTTVVSVTPVALAMFNGALYAACAWQGANGTGAIILQRTSQATWATVETATLSTQANNAYTSLGVYNGRLYAGWYSGDGSQTSLIRSTANGTDWTTDFTALATEVPAQMVVFNTPGTGPELYVVMAKTPASGNTTSRVVKRTSGGTWSVVDNLTSQGVYSGGIGIVYF